MLLLQEPHNIQVSQDLPQSSKDSLDLLKVKKRTQVHRDQQVNMNEYCNLMHSFSEIQFVDEMSCEIICDPQETRVLPL